MDTYTLLRFAHIVGFVLLGSGLFAVFVSELRACRTTDVNVFAEAAWYTAVFYDALTLPGAVTVAVSGLLMIFEVGYGFFETPWLVGMWGLFLFEFVEGNTVTRIQFRRTLRESQRIRAQGTLTDEARGEARTLAGQIAHFLDIPLYLVIVYCGALQPDTWTEVIVAIATALAASAVLAVAVPRLARPPTAR